MHNGDTSKNISHYVILPSLFIDGLCQICQLYQDAMTIMSHFGKPDLFVTFTCNPKWPKVIKKLLSN